MPVSRCFYHMVWTTKHRALWLTPQVEATALRLIKDKSISLNCPIHALNGCADHVHVAVSIVPNIAIAEWVKAVKGVSAHAVNVDFRDLSEHFYWQTGYAVLTFGAKNLEFVVDYVERQKEHHKNDTAIAYLEADTDWSPLYLLYKNRMILRNLFRDLFFPAARFNVRYTRASDDGCLHTRNFV